MKKFSYAKIYSFSFNGEWFYQKYKEAEFLKVERNVQNILARQAELDHFMTEMEAGEMFEIEGMFLKPGSPLTITKSVRVDEGDVDINAFTPRRLSGLAAVYVFDNSSKFPDIYVSEVEALGLTWNNDRNKQLIYLSAVSGAEYFFNHFEYLPLLCGVKKYLLKQISAKRLMDIMKIRDSTGTPISTKVKQYWPHRKNKGLLRDMLTLGGTFNLKDEEILTLPGEVRCLFESPAV